ncbi:MAG: hypothetical protein ACREI8_01335 [Myxococcota bacterium]
MPCHRVLAAACKLGGFSARGGVRTKLRLLSIENAPVNGTLPLFERRWRHSRKRFGPLTCVFPRS